MDLMMRRAELLRAGKKSILPSGYKQVEYLENTANGGQYIDTGITPGIDFGFFIDCMPITNVDTTSTSSKILGSSIYNAGTWGGVLLGTWATTNGGQLSWFRPFGSSPYDPGLRSYERVQIENKNDHYTSSTGKSYNTPKPGTGYIYGSLYLFSVHTNRQITNASTRIYSYKAYDGNATVQYLIPCYRKSDNKPGMYDIINDTFYTNAGTGEFILGPEV